jgi:hypothetical protein
MKTITTIITLFLLLIQFIFISSTIGVLYTPHYSSGTIQYYSSDTSVFLWPGAVFPYCSNTNNIPNSCLHSIRGGEASSGTIQYYPGETGCTSGIVSYTGLIALLSSNGSCTVNQRIMNAVADGALSVIISLEKGYIYDSNTDRFIPSQQDLPPKWFFIPNDQLTSNIRVANLVTTPSLDPDAFPPTKGIGFPVTITSSSIIKNYVPIQAYFYIMVPFNESSSNRDRMLTISAFSGSSIAATLYNTKIFFRGSDYDAAYSLDGNITTCLTYNVYIIAPNITSGPATSEFLQTSLQCGENISSMQYYTYYCSSLPIYCVDITNAMDATIHYFFDSGAYVKIVERCFPSNYLTMATTTICNVTFLRPSFSPTVLSKSPTTFFPTTSFPTTFFPTTISGPSFDGNGQLSSPRIGSIANGIIQLDFLSVAIAVVVGILVGAIFPLFFDRELPEMTLLLLINVIIAIFFTFFGAFLDVDVNNALFVQIFVAVGIASFAFLGGYFTVSSYQWLNMTIRVVDVETSPVTVVKILKYRKYSSKCVVSWRWDISNASEFMISPTLNKVWACARKNHFRYVIVDVVTLDQNAVDARSVARFMRYYERLPVIVAIDSTDAKNSYFSRFWTNIEYVYYSHNSLQKNRIYTLGEENDIEFPTITQEDEKKSPIIRISEMARNSHVSSTYNLDRIRMLLITTIPFVGLFARTTLNAINDVQKRQQRLRQQFPAGEANGIDMPMDQIARWVNLCDEMKRISNGDFLIAYPRASLFWLISLSFPSWPFPSFYSIFTLMTIISIEIACVVGLFLGFATNDIFFFCSILVITLGPIIIRLSVLLVINWQMASEIV